MTDTELELHIASIATLIERAMAEGDTAGARAWAAARADAIAARSPEWVAAREAELGLGPCQFVAQGDADRVAVGASQ